MISSFTINLNSTKQALTERKTQQGVSACWRVNIIVSLACLNYMLAIGGFLPVFAQIMRYEHKFSSAKVK